MLFIFELQTASDSKIFRVVAVYITGFRFGKSTHGMGYLRKERIEHPLVNIPDSYSLGKFDYSN